MEMHQPGEMETDAIILLLPATIYERGFQAACFFFPSRESHLQLHINTTNTLLESKSRSLRELIQQVVRDARVEKRRVPLTFWTGPRNWSSEIIWISREDLLPSIIGFVIARLEIKKASAEIRALRAINKIW